VLIANGEVKEFGVKASELILETQSSLLLKGPFGHGKTLAAATFALDGPIWIAYWDKKKPVELYHFFHHIIKRPDLLNNIEYDVYTSHNANEYLNKLFQLARDCRYFACINDSVTNMTSGAVNWSLGFRDTKKLKDKDKIMPEFDEYKIETSLVTQALDICKALPCHIIWTCHPVPSIKIEGSGSSIKVTKTNPIVTYGSKVAGIVPGNFSEIYHFSKESTWDSVIGKQLIKYKVSTEAIGDDFAKSNLGLKGEFDITDKLFYEVWKERVKQLREELKHEVDQHANKPINPFATSPSTDKPSTTNWRT
jgi:hypothetical protein